VILKRTFVALGALSAAVILQPKPASAQSEAEVAARRLLVEQAQQARTAGDHARALEQARRAGEIQMTPSLRFFIAEEHAALDHVGEAFGTADLCVREAERDPALRNRDAILAGCRGVMDTLRSRIAIIVVRVPQPAPQGLSILVQGQPLAASSYDRPMVVAAGSIAVEATAQGQPPFRTTVTLAAGASEDVQIALQPSATGGQPRVIPSPPPRRGNPTLVVAGAVTAGVGAATMIASAVTFAMRNSALGNCTIQPDRIVCPSQMDADRAAGGGTFNTLTNVLLPVGAALTAGGAALLVVGLVSGGPREGARAARRGTWMSVAPRTDGVGLTVGGSL